MCRTVPRIVLWAFVTIVSAMGGSGSPLAQVPDNAPGAASTCQFASAKELLDQHRILPWVEARFKGRFVPSGGEAQLILRPIPDVGKVTNYRVFMLSDNSNWHNVVTEKFISKLSKETLDENISDQLKHIPILSATTVDREINLRLIPSASDAFWGYRGFVTIGCAGDIPVFFSISEARVSNEPAALILSLLFTIGILFFAASAKSRSNGRPRRFRDRFMGLALLSGPNGKASLAIFQILLFSIIVFYMLVLYLLRTGELSVLSGDIAGLLGISAAGAVGGALANKSILGVSGENDAWLRDQKWLPPRDEAPKPSFFDLISTGGSFDIYRFQSFAFNIVVGAAVLLSGFTGLERFEIPDQLLALLGVSQLVYISGKAVTPKIDQLDKALETARTSEQALLDAYDRDPAGATERALRKEILEYNKAVFDAEGLFRAIVGDPATPVKSNPSRDFLERSSRPILWPATGVL